MDVSDQCQSLGYDIIDQSTEECNTRKSNAQQSGDGFCDFSSVPVDNPQCCNDKRFDNPCTAKYCGCVAITECRNCPSSISLTTKKPDQIEQCQQITDNLKCQELIKQKQCKLDQPVICNGIQYSSLCAAILCGCHEDDFMTNCVNIPCPTKEPTIMTTPTPTQDECGKECDLEFIEPLCCLIGDEWIDFDNECIKDCKTSIFERDCYYGKCINPWGFECGTSCELVCNDVYYPVCYDGLEVLDSLCLAECGCRDVSKCQSGLCGDDNGNPFFEDKLYYEWEYGYWTANGDGDNDKTMIDF